MKTVCTSNGLSSDATDTSYRNAVLSDAFSDDYLLDLRYDQDYYDDYVDYLTHQDEIEMERLDDPYEHESSEDNDRWWDDDRHCYDHEYLDPDMYQFPYN